MVLSQDVRVVETVFNGRNKVTYHDTMLEAKAYVKGLPDTVLWQIHQYGRLVEHNHSVCGMSEILPDGPDGWDE